MTFKTLRALPNSIAAQLVAVLLVAMLTFASFTWISLSRSNRFVPPPVALFTERILGYAEMLDQMPREQRTDYLSKMGAQQSKVSIQIIPSSQADQLPKGLDWKTGNLRVPFPDYQAIKLKVAIDRKFLKDFPDAKNPHLTNVFVELGDGDVLIASRMISLRKNPVDRITRQFFYFVCLLLLLLMGWSWWALIRPLHLFSKTVDEIGHDDGAAVALDEKGPTELRKAAHALNRMQARIHHLIEDRTRMLAAVGHDLRTPVTRLRLRSEFLEDEPRRLAILKDLDLMEGLLTRLLTYLRKGETGEEMVGLELNSLVAGQVSEWTDAGYDVTFENTDRLTILGRQNELLGVLDNLIDNAIKYAGSCALKLNGSDGFAHLQVIDHGPGLSEQDQKTLLEPFARGDEARNMDKATGFGLGLAIVQQSARKHGAELSLETTKGGGLTVNLLFPLHS